MPSSSPDVPVDAPAPDAASRAWLQRLRARARAGRRDRASCTSCSWPRRAMRSTAVRAVTDGPSTISCGRAQTTRWWRSSRKLDDFRGDSRFTTWAYKFALLEAGVKTRRRAWQDREVALDADAWSRIADRGDTPDQDAETRELLGAIGTADRAHPHAPPATGARRDHARRRARSTCSPSAWHRPAARCTRPCTTRGASSAPSSPPGGTADDRRSRPHRAPARAVRARAVLRGVLRGSSTATSRPSSPGTTPTASSRGWPRTCEGCPACRDDRDSLAAWLKIT